MWGEFEKYIGLLPIPELVTSRKVDFAICGTQKGGTTALDKYLRKHSDISMAVKKEVHFFDSDKYFKYWIPNYRAYHRFFPNTDKSKLVGESTPIYMYWPSAVDRMFKYNKDFKLIIILRNPILRAYSHWNMEKEFGNESRPFSEAIRTEATLISSDQYQAHEIFSYLDRGLYSRQIKRLWRYFPKSQVYVMKSEELQSQPVRELNKLCEFLKIASMPKFSELSAFVQHYETAMSNADVSFLASFFSEEISELEQLLNWDCSEWREALNDA